MSVGLFRERGRALREVLYQDPRARQVSGYWIGSRRCSFAIRLETRRQNFVPPSMGASMEEESRRSGLGVKKAPRTRSEGTVHEAPLQFLLQGFPLHFFNNLRHLRLNEHCRFTRLKLRISPRLQGVGCEPLTGQLGVFKHRGHTPPIYQKYPAPVPGGRPKVDMMQPGWYGINLVSYESAKRLSCRSCRRSILCRFLRRRRPKPEALSVVTVAGNETVTAISRGRTKQPS